MFREKKCDRRLSRSVIFGQKKKAADKSTMLYLCRQLLLSRKGYKEIISNKVGIQHQVNMIKEEGIGSSSKIIINSMDSRISSTHRDQINTNSNSTLTNKTNSVITGSNRLLLLGRVGSLESITEARHLHNLTAQRDRSTYLKMFE